MISSSRLTIYCLTLLTVIHSTSSDSRAQFENYASNQVVKGFTQDQEQEQQTVSPAVMDTQKCGGLGSKQEKDDHVVEVVNGAKGLVEEKTGLKITSIDIHSYKKQLVSGMNYFVKAILKTEDGLEKIAHLRIYKNLSNETELTAVQLDKTIEEEIVHFQ